jgi:hypothetical protein
MIEKKEIEIHLLSIVDACTGWSEFVKIDTASSIATATGLDKNYDNSTEFMGLEFQDMLDSYRKSQASRQRSRTRWQMQLSNASTAPWGSNSGQRFSELIGAMTLTRSFKRVLMHFVQHNRLKGHTHRHSSYSDTM